MKRARQILCVCVCVYKIRIKISPKKTQQTYTSRSIFHHFAKIEFHFAVSYAEGERPPKQAVPRDSGYVTKQMHALPGVRIPGYVPARYHLVNWTARYRFTIEMQIPIHPQSDSVAQTVSAKREESR